MRGPMLAVFAGTLIGVGNPLIKFGMQTAGISEFLFFSLSHWFALIVNGYFLLGMFSSMAGIGLFIISLSQGKASVLNPISGGVSYIFVIILSGLMLAELITLQKIIGMIVILIGISFLGGSKQWNTKSSQQ